MALCPSLIGCVLTALMTFFPILGFTLRMKPSKNFRVDHLCPIRAHHSHLAHFMVLRPRMLQADQDGPPWLRFPNQLSIQMHLTLLHSLLISCNLRAYFCCFTAEGLFSPFVELLLFQYCNWFIMGHPH